MIELSNGITIRSRNNIHLMTNAFSLQTYEVSIFSLLLKKLNFEILIINQVLFLLRDGPVYCGSSMISSNRQTILYS